MSSGTYMLLALGSAFAGAVATSLGRKVMKYCGNAPEDYMPVHYAILTAGLLPLVPFLFRVRLEPLMAGVLLLALVLDGTGNYYYIRSFSRQRAHRISIIMSLSPLFGLAVVPLLGPVSGTTLGWGQVAGILVILLGLLVLSGEWRPREARSDEGFGDRLGTVYSEESFARRLGGVAQRLNHRRFLFPLAAAAALGVNALVVKMLFTYGAMTPYSYYVLRCGVLALVFTLLFKPNFREFLGTGENAKWAYLRAAFVAAQWLLLLYAIQAGDPVVANAVAGTVPLFVVAVAFVVWKVRVHWYELVGVAVVVAGVVLTLLA